MQNLAELITQIPNFPTQGILFRDISPLLKTRFHETIDAMSALFSSSEWSTIDLVAGIESRGFLFAGALAYKHKKGMVKIRKPGKLPQVAGKMSYSLEYGENTLEMQQGNGAHVLIVDDLLATGGSLRAAADLSLAVGYRIAGLATLINLAAHNQFIWQGQTCRSVISNSR